MKEQLTMEISRTSPDSSLAKLIEKKINQNVCLCYQCSKCSSGCPMSEFFDWLPHQIMRAIQLGQEDLVYKAKTPWLCASCLTCTTRCPQGLDITSIMEFITRNAKDKGYAPAVVETDRFNTAFMREVQLWGRSYEPGLMAEMILQAPKSALEDRALYFKFFQKGKVGIFPHPTRIPSKRRLLARKTDSVAYYPGCSLETTAKEYDKSTRAVCESLELDLVEPEGWVCCGSSAAHRSDPEAALNLPLENLYLMEYSGFQEVTMPCAACYNRHAAAVHEYQTEKINLEETAAAVKEKFQNRVQVKTLIETLLDHVGLEEIRTHVKQPLKDLKVVCYYGCLLTRPPEVTGAPNPENPTGMDRILSVLGSDVLDWSYKTTCCGAAHALTRPDIVIQMSAKLLREAKQVGAEAVSVACPLCHMNLDARQFQMELPAPVPIFYFTQLLAIALGLPAKEAALHKNIVDPRPLLISHDLWEFD